MNKVQYVYKDKAEMNLDCHQLLALVLPQTDLKCVGFSMDKQGWEEEADQNQPIKDFVKLQNSEMEAKIKKNVEEMFAQMMLISARNNESVLNEVRMVRDLVLATRNDEKIHSEFKDESKMAEEMNDQ